MRKRIFDFSIALLLIMPFIVYEYLVATARFSIGKSGYSGIVFKIWQSDLVKSLSFINNNKLNRYFGFMSDFVVSLFFFILVFGVYFAVSFYKNRKGEILKDNLKDFGIALLMALPFLSLKIWIQNLWVVRYFAKYKVLEDMGSSVIFGVQEFVSFIAFVLLVFSFYILVGFYKEKRLIQKRTKLKGGMYEEKVI